MQVFVIINNAEMMRNVDVNVNNLLIKMYVVKDMLGILVIANVNVKNYVMLVSIQIIKIVNVEKGWWIN